MAPTRIVPHFRDVERKGLEWWKSQVGTAHFFALSCRNMAGVESIFMKVEILYLVCARKIFCNFQLHGTSRDM